MTSWGTSIWSPFRRSRRVTHTTAPASTRAVKTPFIRTKRCCWWELPQASFWSRQTQQNIFCHDKSMLTAIKLLLWQAYFWQTHVCPNKSKLTVKKFCGDIIRFVATNICHNKCLSRQKICFVVTKIILVAAPTKDKAQQVYFRVFCLNK